ncbi:9600_t:CDS:2, partial [Racocetra persica]
KFKEYTNTEEILSTDRGNLKIKDINENDKIENKNYPKETRSDVTRLDISNKELEEELDLTDFINLEWLNCQGIASLENSEKLRECYLSDNNFFQQDLSTFSKFTNLEKLRVGNHDQKKIEPSIYNRFIGSLEPLKDLNKLAELDISNTDIDSAKVSDIHEELNPFEDKEYPKESKCLGEIDKDNKGKERNKIVKLDI